MSKLGTAIIMAGCVVLAGLFMNFTPVTMKQTPEDTAASRVVAQAVSAAITMGRTQNSCWTATDNNCRNHLVETNSIELAAEKCGFTSTKGTLKISTATGVPVHCGRSMALNGITLQGQLVDVREPAAVSGVMIDHSATNGNLANFDNASILPTVRSGYGFSVHYDSQTNIRQVDLAERIQTNDSSVTTDQTIVGSAHLQQKKQMLHIDEADMTIYHNVLQLVGKSKLKDLTFDNSCCTPVGGTITTKFMPGMNVAPSEKGSAFVGKVETLTFDGCGKAQLKDYTGKRSHIPVSCL